MSFMYIPMSGSVAQFHEPIELLASSSLFRVFLLNSTLGLGDRVLSSLLHRNKRVNLIHSFFVFALSDTLKLAKKYFLEHGGP